MNAQEHRPGPSGPECELLSVREAARRLGQGVTRTYEDVRAGRLERVSKGVGDFRFNITGASVTRLLEARRSRRSDLELVKSLSLNLDEDERREVISHLRRTLREAQVRVMDPSASADDLA